MSHLELATSEVLVSHMGLVAVWVDSGGRVSTFPDQG